MKEVKKIENAILMGRKPGAGEALEYLISSGINVLLVVASKNETFKGCLAEIAKRNNIPVHYNDKELYKMIEANDSFIKDVDLVISYLYLQRIKNPLIALGKRGCVNFHPAPLPDYKGRAGYNTAILDMKDSFGVSSHFIDSEEFDEGPIIKVTRFALDKNNETAFSLEKKAQGALIALFKEVIPLFQNGDEIKVIKNEGGLSLTGKELEKLKIVDLQKDSAEEIDRKIRAFFFPPYSGAKVVVGEREFTLINDEILEKISKKL